MAHKQLLASTHQLSSINAVLEQIYSMTNFLLDRNDVNRSAISLTTSYPNVANLLSSKRATNMPLDEYSALPSVLPTNIGLQREQSGIEVSAVPAKQKKEKPPVDPNAPKRPVTAYFRFVAANRERIASELPPGTSKGAVQNRATEEWKILPESEQDVGGVPAFGIRSHSDTVARRTKRSTGGSSRSICVNWLSTWTIRLRPSQTVQTAKETARIPRPVSPPQRQQLKKQM